MLNYWKYLFLWRKEGENEMWEFQWCSSWSFMYLSYSCTMLSPPVSQTIYWCNAAVLWDFGGRDFFSLTRMSPFSINGNNLSLKKSEILHEPPWKISCTDFSSSAGSNQQMCWSPQQWDQHLRCWTGTTAGVHSSKPLLLTLKVHPLASNF